MHTFTYHFPLTPDITQPTLWHSERGLNRLVKSVRQRAILRRDGDDDENSLLLAQDIIGGPGGGGGSGSGGEDKGPTGATSTDRATLPPRHRLVDATERVAALGTTPPALTLTTLLIFFFFF